MTWEFFERVSVVLTVVGFITLGLFSWRQQSLSSALLSQISQLDHRLDELSSPVSSYQLPVTPQPCDEACVRQLVDEAIATISGISGTERQQVVERVVEKVTTVASSGPKSQYVPLGAGETTETSWVSLPGAEVTFDISDFGEVSQVYFEVQLVSPTAGYAFARLYDQRTGMIAGSELSRPGGDAALLSARVTIPTGGRTVGVQLRSENGQLVKVLNSRLRIDTR